MGKETGISWTDATWNPFRGCTKVSSGCAACYADTLSKRNPKTLGIWGPNGSRVVAAESYWKQPFQWDKQANKDRVRRKVFCASLADVFEQWDYEMIGVDGCAHYTSDLDPCEMLNNWVMVGCDTDGYHKTMMDDARLRVFNTIRRTPNLDWLLLTKRPEAIIPTLERCLVSATKFVDNGELWGWINGWLKGKPPQNVWLGTSVEDQENADQRIPHLLEVPAKVRWISAEPLLGPVSFWPWLSNPTIAADLGRDFPLLDWIIVGGESGPNARPFDIAWALSIKNQCERASTSFYMKQLGSNAVASFVSWDTKDRAGADPSEWPEDLKRQEFPKIRLGV